VAGAIPAWRAEPDVWLMVAIFAAVYAIALVRLGPRYAAGLPAASRSQVVAYVLGLLALWIAAGWPIHQVAEREMFSVHELEHLIFMMVAPPLLLLGTPAWLARLVFRPGTTSFAVLRACTRFIPALVIFNATMVFAHWPAVINESTRSDLFHYFIHFVMFFAALIVWLPVVSPLPELPRLRPLTRCFYLFAWSILPTVPASFLTFNSNTLYSSYRHLPKLWGLTALQDQQIAGLILKLGMGLFLWALIAVTFFRWASEEDRATRSGTRSSRTNSWNPRRDVPHRNDDAADRPAGVTHNA
jgi:putative membrane protein